MAGDDDVHPLFRDGFEQCDRFGASHGIEAVEWLVQNQHRRMMRNGLRQANALTHPFAVARHFAPGHWRHTSALEGLVCELGRLVVTETVEPQRPINEIVAVRAGRERVELRAVSDLSEKLDGLLRRKTEDVNRAMGWFDQAGQQVHQRGFARTVGADEAGNPRIDGEIHLVHAENFPVKLGDVVEHDLAGVWRHPRTVSRARKRALRMTSESKQTTIRALQAAATGISLRPLRSSNLYGSRNPLSKIIRNMYEKFRSAPQ